MELLNQSRVNGIVRSLKYVFAQKDISKLTKRAYDFVMVSSGFIAHYGLHGFREEYKNTRLLAYDLLDNRQANQNDNFHVGDQDYEYYMQKKEIYNKICEFAKKI